MMNYVIIFLHKICLVSEFDNNSIIIITTCNQINNFQLYTIGRYYNEQYNHLFIIILFSKCEFLVL